MSFIKDLFPDFRLLQASRGKVKETCVLSHPEDRGLLFNLFGKWQPLMRIFMNAERLHFQTDQVRLNLFIKAGRSTFYITA